MSWWTYVEAVAGDATQDAIARATGVTGPTVSRWRTGKQGVDPRAAASFARAYRRPVLEAFVAAGFLTEDEAKVRPAAAPDFTKLTNDQLLHLVQSRMREEGDRDAHTTGSPATTSVTALVPAYTQTPEQIAEDALLDGEIISDVDDPAPPVLGLVQDRAARKDPTRERKDRADTADDDDDWSPR